MAHVDKCRVNRGHFGQGNGWGRGGGLSERTALAQITMDSQRPHPQIENQILASFKRRNELVRRVGRLLYGPLGWTLLALGAGALALLPMPQLQKPVYVDENALLPGQVT